MAITCVFCRDLPLTLNFSGLLRKDLIKRKVKFGGTFFQQTHRHACHTHKKSCCLLSSPVLLRKFTIMNNYGLISVPAWVSQDFLRGAFLFFGGGGEILESRGVRANREGNFSLHSLYPLFASLFNSLFTPETSVGRHHDHYVTVVRLCL